MFDVFFARLRAAGPIEADDLQLLLKLPRTSFTAPAQSAIMAPGEPVEGATVLLQGFACRSRVRSNGARQILSICIPGDALDIAPLPVPRHDGLTALSTCRGVRIPFSALDLAMQRPSLRAAFARLPSSDANMLAERVVSLGRRTALERMAHFFSELAARLDSVGLGANGRYDMPLTQADMADALGLSIVHVNRTLQQLRGTGAISFRSQRLTVHDAHALHAMADFDPGYLQLGRLAGPAPPASQVA